MLQRNNQIVTWVLTNVLSKVLCVTPYREILFYSNIGGPAQIHLIIHCGLRWESGCRAQSNK